MPVLVSIDDDQVKGGDGVGQAASGSGPRSLSLLLTRHLHLLAQLVVSISLLLTSSLEVELLSPANSAWAEPPTSQQTGKLKGNIMQGREIFNGKGVCYYCHGIDGYLSKTPRLEADTAALIARLSPPPTDLRNPDALRLKTNKERARAIREGHPGTGMFPDTTMTDQDLADTLLYLALIRKDPNPEQ
ncbi:MAG: cytochrome c [Nitrospira sp.]|nr:cytochrome c [Nitrospira sp.]